MKPKNVFWVLRAIMVFVLAFSLILDPAAALAVKDEPGDVTPQDLPPGVELVGPFEVPAGLGQRGTASFDAPTGLAYFTESEPNDTPAQANALGTVPLVATGTIYPIGDSDYYAFQASAGDRLFAATQTSFSASASTDSVLELYFADGVTLVEADDNDGTFGSLSSSIAGANLPATGTYYLRVLHTSPTGQLRPYYLYLDVRSGLPGVEVEPNNDVGTAMPLPASGWVSGDTSSVADADFYSLSLNAGDTVFISLDLDPERDTVTWNGQTGLGVFNGFILVANDANAVSPNSEAFFISVLASGTYHILVNVPGGAATFGTYHLSVSVLPAEAGGVCTTYTSTDVPKVIPDGPGMVTSDIFIPGNPIIADLNLSLDVSHANIPDLDAQLISPAGNDNGLFTDVGGSTTLAMLLELDDEAAIPLNMFTVMNGLVSQPEYNYRLSWFDGEDAGGTWTLALYDDLAANGGTLNGWAITICEPPPPPVCAVGFEPVTVFSTDFESSDAGFLSSGTLNEWEWGLPSYAPIDTCASGSGCWTTDLDGTYDASSDQDLLSPAIDLTGLAGPVIVSWAQKYSMESATFDHALAEVRQAGGGSPTILWQWLDATMSNTIGNPSQSITASAGWGTHWREISAYAGQSIELRFHLDADTTVQFPGYAVDDVTVTACAPPPTLEVVKTVGTDVNTCAVASEIGVLAGTKVTYCFEVTNTGTSDLVVHDLVDSELGTLLSNFPYNLTPGASAFLTATQTILADTLGTATWTAETSYGLVASDSDATTVTVLVPDLLLTMTAGLDPNVCGVDSSLIVPSGTDVTYCYSVTNTGTADLVLHDLADSELGVVLNSFPYVLAPSASAFITQTATILVDTVSTATWTGYAENGDLASSADSVTITVSEPPVVYLVTYLPFMSKK